MHDGGIWQLKRADPGFPGELERYLGEHTPPRIWGRGNPAILQSGGVALFSSRRCPGAPASRMIDLAQQIRDAGRTALGGFHSPMEKECLRILLQSPYPVVIGLARTLPASQVPAAWKGALAEGRLLLLSAAPETTRRTTTASARDRNRALAALADTILIAHAESGGSTESFCRHLLEWGKPTFHPDAGDHPLLDSLGIPPVTPGWLLRP